MDWGGGRGGRCQAGPSASGRGVPSPLHGPQRPRRPGRARTPAPAAPCPRRARARAPPRTHPPAAVLEQDVDVLLVLEVVVELDDVLVVQEPVQLDLLVDLREAQAQPRGRRQAAPPRGPASAPTARTFSRWWGLATRLCGMILAA